MMDVRNKPHTKTAAIAGPKPGATDDTIYTTQEYADWIGVSRNTIEKSRSQGKSDFAPYIKLGAGKIGYRHADIIAWLRQNQYNADGSKTYRADGKGNLVPDTRWNLSRGLAIVPAVKGCP